MPSKHKLTGLKTRAQLKRVEAFFDECKATPRTTKDNVEQVTQWCTKAVHDHVILAGYEITMFNHDTLAVIDVMPVDGDVHTSIKIHLKKEH